MQETFSFESCQLPHLPMINRMLNIQLQLKFRKRTRKNPACDLNIAKLLLN
jgi:hypothetical protein